MEYLIKCCSMLNRGAYYKTVDCCRLAAMSFLNPETLESWLDCCQTTVPVPLFKGNWNKVISGCEN
jgi:hypothetical protein